ncbi:MAG TPA: hypothetical protein VGI10_12375 [Polyangiaceae bacterium]
MRARTHLRRFLPCSASALLALAAPARAEGIDAARNSSAAPGAGETTYQTPLRPRAGYLQLFSPVAIGRGLRFNNPYRLQSTLGGTPRSLSLTASYLDVGLGAVWGSLDGIAHGGVAHVSLAVQGIPQEVLSVSYIALAHLGRFVPFGRAGVPIVLQPDASAGLEGALGTAYMLRAGVGVQGELVASLYYGAATIERKVTEIPVLSLELGIWIDYEVLP